MICSFSHIPRQCLDLHKTGTGELLGTTTFALPGILGLLGVELEIYTPTGIQASCVTSFFNTGKFVMDSVRYSPTIMNGESCSRENIVTKDLDFI